MKIAICEDQAPQRDWLVAAIRTWASVRAVALNIYEYANAEAFFFSVATDGPFDLLFLDIDMGTEITGIEIAQELRATYHDSATNIVFTTSHSEYVFQGYKVQALDYLLKPIVQSELYQALEHALVLSDDNAQNTLIISTPTANKRIPYRMIRYCQSQLHYVNIHIALDRAGSFQTSTKTPATSQVASSGFESALKPIERVRGGISDVVPDLPPEIFVRTHRSFVVNNAFIVTANKTRMILDDGTEIPISRNHLRAVDEYLTTAKTFVSLAVQDPPPLP